MFMFSKSYCDPINKLKEITNYNQNQIEMFPKVRLYCRCGYLNSTLNPILYPLCNKNFKIAFKRMLRLKPSKTEGHRERGKIITGGRI